MSILPHCRFAGLAACILILPFTAAEAQECMGGLAVGDIAQVVGVSAAGAGAQRVMVASYERLGNQFQLATQAGFSGTSLGSTDATVFSSQVSWRPGEKGETGVRACPYLRGTLRNGPSDDRYALRQIEGAAGLSLGRTLSAGTITVAPFAHLGVLHLRERSRFDGQTGDLSRNIGESGVGVGLRFSDRLMVTPSYRRPFGAGSPLGAAEPTYSLTMRFGFRQ